MASKKLSPEEFNSSYQMIKGRIAETLIQELFLTLGFNVFKYGMENTIPGVMELLKGIKSEVANNIKRMPDFVMQDRDTKNLFFIEVKYRKSECFKLSDIGQDYPYKNAYIVLVSKKHIKCLSFQSLLEGKEITPTCKNYLGSIKEFNLDKETIINFCNFAVKFFENIE